MLRGRNLVMFVMLVSIVGACHEQPLLPTALEPMRADFIDRDLVLDLRVQEDQTPPIVFPWRLGNGWERPTPEGVWAVGRSAELEAVLLPGVRSLRVECRPFHGLNGDQRVEIYLGEERIGVFEPKVGRLRWYEVALPETVFDQPPRSFRFEFARARSPLDAGIGQDRRQLALFVRRIAFTGEQFKVDDLGQATGIRRIADGWKVSRPGRLFVNLTNGDSSLEYLEVGCWNGPKNAEECTAWVVRPADDEPVPAAKRISGAEEPDLYRFDLSGLEGPLQVVVDMPSAPLNVMVRGSERVQEPPKNRPDRSRSASPDTPPDIVVLVLDATRADHAGASYGYARDTLGRLGRWTRDALVFDSVFAQAPYTSCSVPTMFTGVDFSSHGVIRNNDRLHDDEVTLAESLQAAGYLTIGFTATPNNSRHLGMAQGFDEFTQVWEGVDWLTSIDPFFMAAKVATRIDQGLGNDPIFMMIHLVPPHSPYTPPEQFRVFSDPSYQGPADGSQSYLSSIRGRPEAVSEADLEALIALYDANLVYADTAADKILQALSAAGRFENAVLLVTADHGEAFFEHGEESHNSTVYDEMLQVPFMLRLPGGAKPSGLDVSRFASLEDLTPTLLSLAGIAPGPRATGLDLLGDADREHMLLRSADQQKITGFRLGRHKVIADRWGKIVELYDLSIDPGEKANLFIHRPGTVSWLADEWRRALAAVPPLLAGGKRDVTDAEREMLQQLGYVE